MVTINRTREDSGNNARVLLQLIYSHGVQSGAAKVLPTPVVNWDKHALRLNVHQLC